MTILLGVLKERNEVFGAIDATTLEANAAMRSIVQRDTGESYEEFLRGLAKASGIETPTRVSFKDGQVLPAAWGFTAATCSASKGTRAIAR